ncbi:hypothetical protein U1Q18_002652, partial [Sarracenia purpurea var. burkii]
MGLKAQQKRSEGIQHLGACTCDVPNLLELKHAQIRNLHPHAPGILEESFSGTKAGKSVKGSKNFKEEERKGISNRRARKWKKIAKGFKEIPQSTTEIGGHKRSYDDFNGR